MQTKITRLLILLLALNLTLGCQIQKKNEDRAYRFFRENPVKLAELCADNFPVKDSISPGKEIVKTDTVYKEGVSIPCPPVPGQKTVYVKCPDQETLTKTIHKTDTIFRENTAHVDELSLKLSKEHDARLLAEMQSDDKTKYIWFSVILFVALIGLIAKRVL